MSKVISPEDYLARHFVLEYIEDAIAQLLVYKDDAPKVDINRFFAQYFQGVKDGHHVILREFSFINKIPHNRASFINLFYHSFAALGKKGDLLSIRDYYSLVNLLCTDFPYELLQKTAKIVLIDDAHDCLISFTDFLYAFQVQLYFNEFLELSHQCYEVLSECQSLSPRDIVVPTDQTSVQQAEKHMDAPNAHSGDGVDSGKFFRALTQLSDKHKCSMPTADVLKEVLSGSNHVTFYGFLVNLSKSEAINQTVGRLPSRENIFEGIELNFGLGGLQLHASRGSAVAAAPTAPGVPGCSVSVDVAMTEPDNTKSLDSESNSHNEKSEPPSSGTAPAPANTTGVKKDNTPHNRSLRALRSRRRIKQESSDSDSSDNTSDESDSG